MNRPRVSNKAAKFEFYLILNLKQSMSFLKKSMSFLKKSMLFFKKNINRCKCKFEQRFF